jgi:hypothetical protein
LGWRERWCERGRRAIQLRLAVQSACVQQRADGFTSGGFGDIAVDAEVKDEHGNLVLVAHRERGHVHDAEVLAHGFGVREFVVSLGGGVFLGVGGVDTIDLRRLHQQIAVEFGGAQGGAGVGGKERVARASGEDDDAAFFHVPDGAVANEAFSDGFDFDGGLHPGIDAQGEQFFFQGEGVDDGAQHAHVVGGGLLDVALLGEFGSPDDVAAPHNDGELDTHSVGLLDLMGDVIQLFGLDAEAAWLAEGLAGDFEEDSVEGGHGKSGKVKGSTAKNGNSGRRERGTFGVLVRIGCEADVKVRLYTAAEPMRGIETAIAAGSVQPATR